MTTASTHTLPTASPRLGAAAPATSLQHIEPGLGLWLYVEGGSSLYCQAGQVRVHSLWNRDLRLCAEDAPYCNGAHAGWYQVEALAQQPATLHITQPPQSLWQNTLRTLGAWLGW